VNKRLIVVECKNLDMPRLTEFDMKVWCIPIVGRWALRSVHCLCWSVC
jgi:hypothetical protein